MIVAGVACAHRSALPPDQLVSYGVDAETEGRSLVVKTDGTAIESIHWPDGPSEHRRRALSATELAALEHDLETNKCCQLRAHRVYAVANDVRHTLSIRWKSMNCEVQMWRSDWDENSQARACRDAVLRGAPRSPD